MRGRNYISSSSTSFPTQMMIPDKRGLPSDSFRKNSGERRSDFLFGEEAFGELCYIGLGVGNSYSYGISDINTADQSP